MTAARPNPAIILIVLAALALVLYPQLVELTYGALDLTHHAKTAHAGEAWQASDIAQAFDGKRDCGGMNEIHIRKLPDGNEAHFCEIKPGYAIGLIIAFVSGVGVIITGFAANPRYWRNIR